MIECSMKKYIGKLETVILFEYWLFREWLRGWTRTQIEVKNADIETYKDNNLIGS